MKKDPSERYVSVTAFADDLKRYLKDEPISARPDTVSYRAAKFLRRNATVVVLAAVAVAASGAGLVGTALQVRSTRAERDLALRQLSRAERITELNEVLLTDVAPKGISLTPSQILEREEQIVEREHYDSAAGHVEMLLAIGDQYSGQDQNASALRVLEKAYQLSRGIEEKSVRARASCVLAGALLHVGDLPRAETLFQQGISELPRDRRFSLDRAHACCAEARLRFTAGILTRQSSARSRPSGLLKNRRVQPDFQELNLLVNLAGIYGDAGRFREADATFEQAGALMTNLGYDETPRAVQLFNDWALILTYAGRQLQAEQVYVRAMEASKTSANEDSVPAVLLYNYSNVLRDLGRFQEAKNYAERAAAKARDVGDSILTDQIDLQLARIYRDQHDWQRADALLSGLEPKAAQQAPAFALRLRGSDNRKALLAQARGDLSGALRLANEAVAIDEASIQRGGPCAAYLPVLLVRRAEAELEVHQTRQAAADAERALSLFGKTFDNGALSSHVGRAYLVQGRVLQQEGKLEEAQNAFSQAAVHLEDTLGPAHPDSRIARTSAEALRATQ